MMTTGLYVIFVQLQLNTIRSSLLLKTY